MACAHHGVQESLQCCIRLQSVDAYELLDLPFNSAVLPCASESTEKIEGIEKCCFRALSFSILTCMRMLRSVNLHALEVRRH